MRLVPSLPAIAFALAALSTGAQAAAGWAPTGTLRHDIGNAVAGDAMRPGETLHVAVALKLRDRARLDALAADVMAGRTTRYLTPAQFLSRHAPTAAQVQSVVDHLRRSGFTHITVAPNRLLVSADGTAATAQAAFHVAMQHVRIDGRDAYANVSDAMVPSSLSAVVGAVLGLQDVDHPHAMFKLAGAASAGTSASANASAGSAARNTGAYPASWIYQYGPGHQAQMFHDITSGSNGGYSASAGFDFATGFGSMDVLKFGRFAKKHPGF